MINTLEELKAFLKPGVVFQITSPVVTEGVPMKRKVTSSDASGIHYVNPDYNATLEAWNNGFIPWRRASCYYFDANAFYFVNEPDGKGQVTAFRCEYVEPKPT